MKKFNHIGKIILSSLMSLLLILGSASFVSAKEISIEPVTEESGLYENVPDNAWTSNNSEAVSAFNAMQDRITKSMTLVNGKYVYDYEKIHNIVYEFDFTEINQELGTSWNRESFLQTAINLIDNFESKNIDESESACSLTRASMCNQNWETEGWNYGRSALDKNRTNYYATLCDNYSVTTTGAGALAAKMTAAVPILAGIMLAAGLGASLYYSSFASWLRHNNSLTNCGTVVDINRFTCAYTIWTQPEFANR